MELEELIGVTIGSLPQCKGLDGNSESHEWINVYSEPYMSHLAVWTAFPELDRRFKALKVGKKKFEYTPEMEKLDEEIREKYAHSSFLMPYQICKHCYLRSETK